MTLLKLRYVNVKTLSMVHQMLLGRNEQCHCGSGRKYKHCHLPIDEARPSDKYGAAQVVYARNWNTTAAIHYDEGRYKWMAEQLLPYRPTRILDIGCGSGHGIRAIFELLGSDTCIISIDENGACLDIAARTLRSVGIEIDIIKRLSVTLGDEGFALHSRFPTIALGERSILVEADILDDPVFMSALDESSSFDAVTVWLTGIHMLRPMNREVIRRGVRSDGEHRLHVQNTVYQVADRVLRSGGVLQVVDRAEEPKSQEIKDDILRSHRDQASVTNLVVRDLQFLPYEEPLSGRTPMTLTLGTSGRLPADFTPAMISIISEKP